MKNILKKEFMLGIHPSCYITFAFILCALIPNFPMIVVFFYPFCIFLRDRFLSRRDTPACSPES